MLRIEGPEEVNATEESTTKRRSAQTESRDLEGNGFIFWMCFFFCVVCLVRTCSVILKKNNVLIMTMHEVF